jgi:hypothetical protein
MMISLESKEGERGRDEGNSFSNDKARRKEKYKGKI